MSNRDKERAVNRRQTPPRIPISKTANQQDYSTLHRRYDESRDTVRRQEYVIRRLALAVVACALALALSWLFMDALYQEAKNQAYKNATSYEQYAEMIAHD